MAGKGFNLFYDCAARYVHLSPQEEENTSFSWHVSKICTSGSTDNSQRMLTKVNESDAIAKVRVLVESNTVKHLKY